MNVSDLNKQPQNNNKNLTVAKCPENIKAKLKAIMVFSHLDNSYLSFLPKWAWCTIWKVYVVFLFLKMFLFLNSVLKDVLKLGESYWT